MQDSFGMRGHESRGDAARDVDCFVVRQPSDAPQQLGQILAVDVLHRHEVRAFPIDDVVDAADIRMRDLASEADLVVQPPQQNRIASQSRGQKLERYGLIELRIVSAIDLAHSTRAEDPGDAITIGDDRAGRELRYLDMTAAGRTLVRRLDARRLVRIGRRSRRWYGHGGM